MVVPVFLPLFCLVLLLDFVLSPDLDLELVFVLVFAPLRPKPPKILKVIISEIRLDINPPTPPPPNKPPNPAAFLTSAERSTRTPFNDALNKFPNATLATSPENTPKVPNTFFTPRLIAVKVPAIIAKPPINLVFN